jgi:hypothetical protein
MPGGGIAIYHGDFGNAGGVSGQTGGPCGVSLSGEEWVIMIMRSAFADGESKETPPLPPFPTTALPGSREKVRVMEHRRECGYHIHHPEDATFDDRDDPLRDMRVQQEVNLELLLRPHGLVALEDRVLRECSQ